MNVGVRWVLLVLPLGAVSCAVPTETDPNDASVVEDVASDPLQGALVTSKHRPDAGGEAGAPCPGTGGHSATIIVTPWQMNNGEGLVGFKTMAPSHGDESEYRHAKIPPARDSRWKGAPNPETIGYRVASSLCGKAACLMAGQFTYFQTFVTVPAHSSATRFSIKFAGIDDGARTTVFNSSHPNGAVVPGSDVRLGNSGTANLTSLVKAGETNRVVVTHVDDCCSESFLRSARVEIEGQSTEPGSLDDGNPCTRDFCDPVRGVIHEPLPDDASCSNADACDGLEVCRGGMCRAGSPPAVDDGDFCTTDTCDPAAGPLHVPATDGTPCDDRSACTLDTCQAGICRGETIACPAIAKECQLGPFCDPLRGPCVYDPVPPGTTCGDSDVCNGTESCDGHGACIPGSPPPAPLPTSPCQIPICDPQLGWRLIPAPPTTSCSDGDACNGREMCNGNGACVAGDPPSVEDNNACTLDTCDPGTGPVHTPVLAGVLCSDGNACNGIEACDAKAACLAGAPPELDDGNPCTVDACDPIQGATHTPVPGGSTPSLYAVSSQGEQSTNEVYRFRRTLENTWALDTTLSNTSLGLSAFDLPGCLLVMPNGDLLVSNRGTPDPAAPGGSLVRVRYPMGTPFGLQPIVSPLFKTPHWMSTNGTSIYVAQRFGQNVLRASSSELQSSGVEIAANFPDTTPRGSVVTPWGELVVSRCCGVDRLDRFLVGPTGALTPNGVITGNGLANPHDMEFSQSGELFVTNPAGQSVSRFVFDAERNAIGNGQLTGTMNAPIGLAFSPAGDLFVSSHLNTEIYRWTFDGAFQTRLRETFVSPQSMGDIAFTCTGGQPNQTPLVDAGPDQTVTGVPASVILHGRVGDDGLPLNGGIVLAWSVISGPGGVTFLNANAASTTATFSLAGIHVLRLTVTDGDVSAFDDLRLKVGCPTVATGTRTFLSRQDFATTHAGMLKTENFDSLSSPVTVLFGGSVAVAPASVFFGSWNAWGTAGVFSGGGLIPEPRFQGRAVVLSFPSPVAGVGANAFDDGDGSPPINRISLIATTASGKSVSVAENFDSVGDTGFLGASSDEGIVRAEFKIDNTDGNLELDLLTIASCSDFGNQRPTVNAGADQIGTFPGPVDLIGTAFDDGLPAGSVLSLAWAKASGPGDVTFANPSAPQTTAAFSAPGTYILRLTASDGELSSSDDTSVTVGSGVLVPDVVGFSPESAATRITLASLGVGVTTTLDRDVALQMTALPSEMGWTFESSSHLATEADVYSVSDGVLHINSMGVPQQGGGSILYKVSDIVEPSLRSVVSMRARIAESDGSNPPLQFGVRNGTEQCSVAIARGLVVDGSNRVISTDDNGDYRDYRLECIPGDAYRFFIDGVLAASAPLRPFPGGNSIYLGDGTGGGNVRADIASFSFSQPRVVVQAPAANTLVPPQSLVNVTVATGLMAAIVPDLTGLGVEVAEALLAGAGLHLGPVFRTRRPDAPDGLVLDQSPVPGVRVRSGGSVEVFVPVPEGCVAPLGGLVSRWRFNEDLHDSAGGHDGTSPSQLGFADGFIDRAAKLVGQFVEIPSSQDFAFQDEMTVEMWVNPQGRTGGLVTKQDNAVGGWATFYNADAQRAGFSISPQNGPAAAVVVSPDGAVLSGHWSHLVAVASPGSMKLYVNGEEVATGPGPQLTPTQFSLLVGAYQRGGGKEQFSIALMDDLALYNRALTPDEIRAAFVAGAAPTCPLCSPESADDGNPCTIDTCDPATGAKHAPVVAETACPDDNACNGTEVCDGLGACVAGSDPVVCPPVDQCLLPGGCDPATGNCVSIPKPPEAPCAGGCQTASANLGEIEWVDWISIAGGSAIGQAGAVQVSYSGEMNPGAITGGSENYWLSGATTYMRPPDVENPPVAADIIRLTGGSSQVMTVQFSRTVVNPVMGIVSLGTPSRSAIFDFVDAPFTILNNGPGHWGGGPLSIQSGDVLIGAEGHGLIQFQGAFSSISWTAPIAEFWYGFNFGIHKTVTVPCGGGLACGGEGRCDGGGQCVCLPASLPNQAPLVEAGQAQTIALGEQALLSGSAVDDGLPLGSTLQVTWAKVSGPGEVVFGSTLAAMTAATFSAPGTYVLSLGASDGALAASDNVTITVAEVSQPNAAPVVSAGAAQTITLPGTATLAGTAADDGFPTGSSLSCSWGRVSGPGAVAFLPSNALVTTAVFPTAGVFVLRLTCSDGPLSAFSNVVVTVNPTPPGPNQPPHVVCGPDVRLRLPVDVVSLTCAVVDDGLPEVGFTGAFWAVEGPAPQGVDDVQQTFDGLTATLSARLPLVGEYTFTLHVTDSELEGQEEVVVTLRPENVAPSVSAGPDLSTSLPLGGGPSTFMLNGTAVDDGAPEPVALVTSWFQEAGPVGCAIGNVAMTSTSVSCGLAGSYRFRLEAFDGVLLSVDWVDVTIGPPKVNEAPVVNAGGDGETLLSSALALAGTVTDDGLPAGTLTVGWEVVSGPPDPVTFTPPHSASLTASFTAPGRYVLRLTATDGLLSAFDEVTVLVFTPPDDLTPVVAFTAPVEDATVTAPTSVTGTANDTDLLEWRLSYRFAGTVDWTVLRTSTASVVAGALADLDPTLLENGIYELQLAARDLANQTSIVTTQIVVDGNLKVGNFTVSFKDLSVPVAGIPIEVIRTYDSRNKRRGDFGFGWSLDIKTLRVQKNRVIGQTWGTTVEAGGPFGIVQDFCVVPSKRHYVTATFADGKVFRWEAKVVAPGPGVDGRRECQRGAQFSEATVEFQPLPPTTAALSRLGGNAVLVSASWPGEAELQSTDGSELFDPDKFVVTLHDGRELQVGQAAGLEKITDSNGNVLELRADGLLHSAGKSIVFGRDGQGRITQITDPNGKTLAYAYDGAGDLTGFTDQVPNTTQYAYDGNHYLLGITDARGITPIQNQYDPASGRLVSNKDADDYTITYKHEISARKETVCDRLNHCTVHEYDDRGNVLKTTDALGHATSYLYDDRDNKRSECNPLGECTTFDYDGVDNKRKECDPLLNCVTYTYDGRGNVRTVKDPLGHTTTNSYDDRGNLLTSTNDLGNATEYEYNANGTQKLMRDAALSVTAYGYDDSGNLTSETDALLRITNYEYDLNGNRTRQIKKRTRADGATEILTTIFAYDGAGRLVKTTHPDGSVTETRYNEVGMAFETRDALLRMTGRTYDDMGRLITTTFPDGTSEGTTYDAEGRRIASRDRQNRETSFLYDEVGRLLRTTFPGGRFTAVTYDEAGRTKTTKDEAGNVTTFGYDAAGRRIGVEDPLHHVTTFGYDDAGNQKVITDALDHFTTFDYDNLGRQVRTTFFDGTTEQTEYDVLGRRTAKIDQAGVRTEYGYDVLGRLVRVKDATGGVTEYTYDELGNQVTQKDAEGRITRFAYDAMGRRVRRTLPAVAPATDGAFETMAYDVVGNMTKKTDFTGRSTDLTYDDANRLRKRLYVGGRAVSFTYSDSGRRLTAVDGRGTTSYLYDQRDRVIEMRYPDGRKLTYGYDDGGRRESMTAHVAGQMLTTTWGYDVAGRMTDVTDARGGEYGLGYDPVGRRTSLAQPNGTNTTWGYDGVGHLKTLVTTHGATTIQSYTYTLGPTGIRTRIDEAGGVARAYGYDLLYRLTGEAVTGTGAAGLDYRKAFEYDHVGNRLQQTTTGFGAASVAYAYDARDRLVTEAGAAYSWDANGNMLGKTSGDSYEWDEDDRLVRVVKPDGSSVEHTYDVDGVRVKSVEKAAGGATTRVREYLVDTSGGLSHVVAETDGTAVLVASYVRTGDQLLGEIKGGGEVKQFHLDGLGSVRALTAETGGATDGYGYTAFGEQLGWTGADGQPYGFAGEEWEQQLHYHRARWYHNLTGRFLSHDPWRGNRAEPSSLGRYHYGAQNPVLNGDPSGLFSVAEVATTSVVLSVVSVAIFAANIPKSLIANRDPVACQFSLGASEIRCATSDGKEVVRTTAYSGHRGNVEVRSKPWPMIEYRRLGRRCSASSASQGCGDWHQRSVLGSSDPYLLGEGLRTIDFVNDSYREDWQDLGPIPRGFWRFARVGEFKGMQNSIVLEHGGSTQAFGRSGFLIHGGTDISIDPDAISSSAGCIILNDSSRARLGFHLPAAGALGSVLVRD